MNFYDIEFVKGFIRMCDDGWQQGWHERNGGNLSYRLSEKDVEEAKEYFKEDDKWQSIGASVPDLANEYFNYTHPYGQWKDTGIRLEGDAVQSLTVTFLEMWNAVSDKDANDPDFGKYIFPYDYKAQQTGFIQPYADSPMDNEQVGEEVYISMINKAEKYCWFMTPYLIITDEMTHALCLAAKRGVDVRIITPGIPDKKFIYNITRSFYHGLVKHGVRVYEWTPGFCHAKMSVVDDCMATCGTINLDYRSLYHHFENGCFMIDCQSVLDIKSDLIKTMGECRDVTEQYCTGRSAYLRLGQLFMRLFAGLL